MANFEQDFNDAYKKLYECFVKHVEFAKDFIEKVEKTDVFSEKTKTALIGLGIAMIASHFVGK